MILYIVTVIFVLTWVTILINKRIAALDSDFSDKFDELKKLLFDLRDGTNTFYEEKRKSERVRDNVTMKIVSGGLAEFVKALDLSEGGALIRTSKKLKENDVIDLNIYLKLYAEPISAKASVARVLPSEDDISSFDIGLKFLDMSSIAKERLIETLNVINRKRT